MPTESEIHLAKQHQQMIDRGGERYRCLVCGETIQIRSKTPHEKSKYHKLRLLERLDLNMSSIYIANAEDKRTA